MSTSNRKRGILGFFRRKQHSESPVTALAVAGSSATASAESANVSGSVNSAAALRGLRNASDELNDYFQSTDGRDASLGNVVEKSRWVEKAQACSNSSFAQCSLIEVPHETSRRQLLRLAALSAVKVYAREGTQHLISSEFDEVGSPLKIDADLLGGSVKATTTVLYAPREDGANSSNVIVVAIRGSVTTHDWMVNLNDGAEWPVEDTFLGTDTEGGFYNAHAGFLTCAKAMNVTVVDQIYGQLCASKHTAGAGSKPTLLFTGHSAGGAVAAMLYAHFLKCDPVSDDREKSLVLKSAFSSVHCITFGAPPITTKPVVPFQGGSIFLSIVNNGDPVPRADNAYIHSLLRLFSGPIPEKGAVYALPARRFFNAGQVLVALPRGTLLIPNESGAGSLSETVMGDIRAHKMVEYRRRIEL
ncbi:Alpha/Beta hydrolase protein [Lasiosphaeris hirsuta]|uniref:Alpha/Beta hydrolase protein n=1 Tax=Lasiosphaeris hirsuta TaxID=260670 RepID=A0AA39ZSH6_9PEZI|nr:Alpha/Beta hydrolase protein [Lasiosphaeris hirsuta]